MHEPGPAVLPSHWANLLWAVSAPDIVRGGLPWLPAERRQRIAGFFSGEPVRRRLAPALETLLESGGSSRLGVYFEDLWAFAFEHHPDYELLARNLALRDGKRTLGELDFVVRHRPCGAVEHWELAVKFYLQVADEFWVGPGLHDRLDIKLARMREHQLPLIRQPVARELLARLNIHIDSQWALMPGRLYRPIDAPPSPLHSNINPASCRCWWAPLDEFQFHFAARDLRWVRLPKRTWLADSAYRVLRDDRCGDLVERLKGLRNPVCVAALGSAGEEVSRGFLVPDDWYEEALSSL